MIPTNNPNLVGFLIINKPKDAMSFRAIAQIRRILQNKKLKAGFSGILDPFATGLLIIALGREATRELEIITRWSKRYVARAKLGERTDTLDYTGEIVEWCSAPVSHHQLQAAIGHLGKHYTQTPPIFSALKHNGVRMYELARHKKKPHKDLLKVAEDKARTVELHEVILTNFEYPWFTLEADVSHGTYIRTLVDDIAHNAHSCATTYELTRTAIGKVTLDLAIDLDAFTMPEDITNNLISVEDFKQRFFL